MNIEQLDGVVSHISTLTGVRGPFFNTLPHKCQQNGIRLKELLNYLKFVGFEMYIVDVESDYLYKASDINLIISAIHQIRRDHKVAFGFIQNGFEIEESTTIELFVGMITFLDCKIRLYDIDKGQFDKVTDNMMNNN